MKVKHFIISLIITVLFTTSVIPDTTVTADTLEDTPKIEAQAAISIDASDGTIFYEKNAEKALPIASTTKILTMYIVLKNIKEGKLSWEDQVSISEHLEKLSHDLSLSNVYLYANETYSVKDLFTAMESASANAATIALAEKVAGSEKGFVDLMRAQLKEWKIDDAYLISTSGLNNDDTLGQRYPGSKDGEENLMSAKDLATVAYHLLNDYPEILEFTSQSTGIFSKGTPSESPISTFNYMLPGQRFFKEGVDGLKTGTTLLAGTCFVGTIKQNDRRVITVILHSEDMPNDSGKRFSETALLMDDALENWKKVTVYNKENSQTAIKNIAIKNGEKTSLNVTINDDIQFWQYRNEQIETEINYTAEKDLLNSDNELVAPITDKEQVGTLTFTRSDNKVRNIFSKSSNITVPLLANESVDKAPWYAILWRSITSWF